MQPDTFINSYLKPYLRIECFHAFNPVIQVLVLKFQETLYPVSPRIKPEITIKLVIKFAVGPDYTISDSEKQLPPMVIFAGLNRPGKPKHMFCNLCIPEQTVGRLRQQGIRKVY